MENDQYFIIITASTTLIGIILTHYFTKIRKIDELLFNARNKAYVEFMKNFGSAFGPSKILLKDLDNLKLVEVDCERRQRVGRVFSQCRLLASPLLERKLRHLYDLVISDMGNDKKSIETKERTERDYIGYEIEALMRKDLKVIGILEVLIWRSFSFYQRCTLKIKTRKQNK